MLTRRGWLTGAGAAALLIGGRVLGFVEGYVAGSVLAALLVVSVVWLAVTRLSVEVSRELHPERVHAGNPSRIDLLVTNRGTRPSPLLTLRDRVSGTRGALLVVNPLASGATARAAYRFPTERRGVVAIGPLEVEVADPLGLSRLVLPATGVSELIVYPLVEHVPAIPLSSGNDPMAGAEHPNALGRSGEDFYALRPYVIGDDLRRVHWPSTARNDDLLIRQDELPWQGRATLLLDVRASRHDAETLERAVSAAASLVVAGARRQDLLRLVTTAGADSGFAAGHGHAETLLEHLACIPSTDDSAFGRAVDALGAGATGGALVVIGGGLTDDDRDRLQRLGRRYGSFRVVSFTGEAHTTTTGVTGGTDGWNIEVPPGTPFPRAWTTALAMSARRNPATVGRAAP
ncbi:MAG: DUF58 domain-containing protein [Acidimicrobiales bacterium]|nr:DUF58 domain-containing protein [Acidimicrobiales bacterium]